MYSSIIYRLDGGGGFFSTYFFLCKACLTARKLRIPFYLDNTHWPYKVEKGWHDYFRTLEDAPKFNLPYLKPRVVHHIEQSQEPDFTLHEYRNLSIEIFKLHPHLIERAYRIIEKMAGNYIAIFVRRGDKLIEEAPFIPVESILAEIPHTKDTRFFIQTDDYTVVEEFKAIHPEHLIHYTVPHHKRGQYLHRGFIVNDRGINKHISSVVPLLEQPKSRILEETEEMLVGLTVCYSAPQCWTDKTSNVGRFLKLMSPDKVHFYPGDFDVDFNQVNCPSNMYHEKPLTS